MSPKKRKPENRGLPERWRFRYNAYYYQVPPGMEQHWDGKREFRLGKTLSEAYKVYADRLETPGSINTMAQLFDRYSLEVTPAKAAPTQKDEFRYIKILREVFGNQIPELITPRDIYLLQDNITKKRGATTSNRMLGVLSHVFTKAIEWGAISDHPIVGKVRKNKIVPKRRVPELDEIESALQVAPPLIECYVDLKLMTGLRMTDMLSIKLSDIKSDGVHVTPSKTKHSSGKRLIFEFDHDGELQSLLNKIKNLKKPVGSIWLFCTRKGQPYIKEDKSCNAFQSMWQRWQNKALEQGLIENKFSEKSVRNRVGSDMRTAEDAAELLAHSSTDTTRKHYRNSPVKIMPNTRKRLKND